MATVPPVTVTLTHSELQRFALGNGPVIYADRLWWVAMLWDDLKAHRNVHVRWWRKA